MRRVMRRMMRRLAVLGVVALGLAVQSLCAQQARRDPENLRPGINVLLDEQLSHIRGRRVVLIVDGGARDNRGDRVTELFSSDKRVRAARIVVAGSWRPESWPEVGVGPLGGGRAADSVQLVRLSKVIDSVAQDAQTLVVDLLDGGMRSSAAPWIMLAVLRRAAQNALPVVVLDRPNPLTGEHVEGPTADSTGGASDALYGLPSRHGMTIGEIARWFNAAGRIGAALEVIPVRGWRRSLWPLDRHLPTMLPGGREITPAQLALLGTLAPLGGTNLLVSPGPGRNSVSIGAPWLNAKAVWNALADRLMAGVKFTSGREDFAHGPAAPIRLPSLSVEVTNRDNAAGLRVLLGILAAVRAAHPDSLHLDAELFDRLVGTPTVRSALFRGDDPDAIADRHLASVLDFRRRARLALLYR